MFSFSTEVPKVICLVDRMAAADVWAGGNDLVVVVGSRNARKR